jgi:hypothetical protein
MQISDYGEVLLDTGELRAIIRGEMTFRKCPDCQSDCKSWTLHYVLADSRSGLVEFKEVSAQFAADFQVDDFPQYSYGECFLYDCDTCGGVGYVPSESI